MESRINNQITSTSTSVTLDQATANQVIGVLTQTNQELTRKNQELTARLTRVEGETQVLMGEKAVLKNELNILRARLAAENASQSQPMPSVTQRVVVHSKRVATIQQPQASQPASNRQALVREFNEKVNLKADTKKFSKLPAKERAYVYCYLANYYSGSVKDTAGQVVGVVDLAKTRELFEELKANDELFRALSARNRANVCYNLSRHYSGLVKDTAGQAIGVVDLAKARELLEELKANEEGFSALYAECQSWVNTRLAELNSTPVTQTATTQERSTSTGTELTAAANASQSQPMSSVTKRVAANPKPVAMIQQPQASQPASNRQALEREFNEKVALKGDAERFNKLPAEERANVLSALIRYYGGLIKDTVGQVVGVVDQTKVRELFEELKANDELFRVLSTGNRCNVCSILASYYSGLLKDTAGKVVGPVDLAKARALLEELKTNNELFRALSVEKQSEINKRLAELNSNRVTHTATTQEPSTSTGTKRSSTVGEEGEKAAEKRARVEASEKSASNDAPVVVKQEPLDDQDASAAFSLVDFSGNGSEKGNEDVVDLG